MNCAWLVKEVRRHGETSLLAMAVWSVQTQTSPQELEPRLVVMANLGLADMEYG